MATEAELKDRVNALSLQEFGPASLGCAEPWRTADVDYIVRQGDRAVPFLIRALESRDHVRVGYAACCLELMGSADGLNAAKQRLAGVAKQDEDDWKKTFASNCLEEYLAWGAGVQPPWVIPDTAEDPDAPK
jgi:hypothetical protein